MKKIYKGILLITTCLFIALSAYSQISSGGTPPSIIYELKSEIIPIVMPAFDVQAMIEEDNINIITKATPYRFAKSFPIDISAANNGQWTILPNGDKIWRVALKSTGAFSLNFIFDHFYIPEKASFFVYNVDKSYILGAFTSFNNSESKVLAVSPVPGDHIIIEYYEPYNVEFSGEFHINQISHDYRGIFRSNKDGSYGQSGSCNVDINCPEGSAWQTDKHAVCRIIMNGAYLCSGALINNTNNNGTPYFLTAHHCTGEPYNTWVFYFNYESPSCNGPDGSIAQTISGSTLRATTAATDVQNLDFCLVEMSSTPPASYSPYYAGWNKSSSAASSATGIHHPSGDVKKISKENDALITGDYNSGQYGDNAHWRIAEWDLGTTEGGSSGSPLFDQNHHIVGDLTGGQAACGNSVNDYYAKLTLSWDYYSTSSKQLKYWLDPASSNVTTLDGYDPNGGTTPVCDEYNNIATSPLTYYTFGSGKWGYWSGHNEYGWTKFAEKYSNMTNQYIHGVYIPCAKANNMSGSSYITVKVWNGNSQPGTELESVSVLIGDFTVNAYNYLAFSAPIQTDGNFFIGYEISYLSPLDTFAIFMAHDRIDAGGNTAFIYNGTWNSCNSLGLNTSFAFDTKLCNSTKSMGPVMKVIPININNHESVQEKSHPSEISIYPNPSDNFVTVYLGDQNYNECVIKIYDIYGKMMKYKSSLIENNKLFIDLKKFDSGMYLFEISTPTEKLSKKVTLVR
ncbi:MAG: T9SS type A sorting domain-containing protein [Bacteroidota bacterium]